MCIQGFAVSLRLWSHFRTVNAWSVRCHGILLHHFHGMFGLVGTVVIWFQSYLKDSTWSVIIEDFTSPSGRKYGLPQDSVYGPIFFFYVQQLSPAICPLGTQWVPCLLTIHNYLFVVLFLRYSSLIATTTEITVNSVKEWMKMNKLQLSLRISEVNFI